MYIYIHTYYYFYIFFCINKLGAVFKLTLSYIFFTKSFIKKNSGDVDPRILPRCAFKVQRDVADVTFNMLIFKNAFFFLSITIVYPY